MKKKNENLITDSDIATIEAMRDRLLSLKIPMSDIVIKRSFELTNKLYPIVHPLYAKRVSEINELAPKTILQEANDIIFERQEEKQREYGPIDESLEDAAIVASIIDNSPINIKTVYAVLIGLKTSRMRWNKKHDTFLDSIGYMAAFENYIRKTENNE